MTACNTLKVLIVEDEALLALAYQMALVKGDCEVVGIAKTAQEAIDIVEHNKPDVVLMDIFIKGDRDGISLTETLRECFDIPIIYISGNTDEQTRLRAEMTNPTAYFDKPVDCDILSGMIKRALNDDGRISSYN